MRLSILVWLALCIALGGCSTTPRVEQNVIAKEDTSLIHNLRDAGDAALRAGSAKAALDAYARAFQLQPTNADLLVRIAAAYRHLEAVEQAAAALERAAQLRPDDTDLLLSTGMSLMAAHRWTSATEHLQRAVERGASSWKLFNALGICADMQGNYPVAGTHYAKAITLQPSALLYNNQGYSLYMAQNFGAAAASFETALQIEPKNPLAWRNLSLLRMRQRDLDGAMKAAFKGGEIPSALNDLGYIAMLDGQDSIAKYLFELAIDMAPNKRYVRAEENLQRLATATSPH